MTYWSLFLNPASGRRRSFFRVRGTADRYPDRQKLFEYQSAAITKNVSTEAEALALAESFVSGHPPEGPSARVWVEEHNPRTGDSYPVASWSNEHGKWKRTR